MYQYYGTNQFKHFDKVSEISYLNKTQLFEMLQ